MLKKFNTTETWIDVETLANLKGISKRAIRLSFNSKNSNYETKIDRLYKQRKQDHPNLGGIGDGEIMPSLFQRLIILLNYTSLNLKLKKSFLLNKESLHLQNMI